MGLRLFADIDVEAFWQVTAGKFIVVFEEISSYGLIKKETRRT